MKRMIRARISIGICLWERLSERVYRVGYNRVIKVGGQEEAEAMRYISAHTTIPIPRLHSSTLIGDVTYMEMDYIPGDSLGYWWSRMTADQKAAIVIELHGYIQQLRDLSPPSEGATCSAAGGQLRDHRVGYAARFGPFKTHDEFHSFLRKTVRLEDLSTTLYADYIPLHAVHRRPYATKFSHGDFAPRNIMIRDGKVTAIIDWDSAGFFPEYWEYTKAHFAPLAMDDWMTSIRDMIPPYEEELKAEQCLWAWFDDPVTGE